MHDIRFIRENPAAFDAGLKKRNLAPLSAELLEIDKRRRAAISESEAIQAKRKALSQQIGMAKRKGENADALMAEVAGLEETLKKGEALAAELDAELTRRLEVLPNLPFDDVPDGTDETGNVEIRRIGSQRNFAFAPKDHVGAGRGDRRDGFRRREQDLGRALRRAQGQAGAARARARAVHARPAHQRGGRLHRGQSAVPGARQRRLRRRPAAADSPRTCSTPTTASG